MADRDPHDDRFRGADPERHDPRPWRRQDDQGRFPPERERQQSYDPHHDRQMEDRGDWHDAPRYDDPSLRHEEPVYDRGGQWRYGSGDYRGGYRGERGDRDGDREDWRRHDLAAQDRIWRDRSTAGYAGSRQRPYEGRPEGFQGGGYQGYEGRSGLQGARHYGDDSGGPSHRGRGPRHYRRSDQRIHEDVSDRLMDDPDLDASDIEVSVSDREVTLSGEVDSKWAKRQAEDCADSVTGVEHVQNNLRVKKSQPSDQTGPDDRQTASQGEGADAAEKRQ